MAASGVHDTLALGAERMARAIGADVIVCATIGLETDRYLAASRPSQPILGMTPFRLLRRPCRKSKKRIAVVIITLLDKEVQNVICLDNRTF